MTFIQFNNIVDAVDNIYEIIKEMDDSDIYKKEYESLIANMYRLIDRTYNMVDYPE